jgi:hypothetical protein
VARKRSLRHTIELYIAFGVRTTARRGAVSIVRPVKEFQIDFLTLLPVLILIKAIWLALFDVSYSLFYWLNLFFADLLLCLKVVIYIWLLAAEVTLLWQDVR